MALSVATTWEVRTGGSDTLCSGGFVSGASGTDYSQQNAAQYNATDLVVDAVTNTKVTSASHNFVAADVGNILRVTAGAGWTLGFFQIVSVASNAATLDRSPAATGTTGGTYYVGGAFASPGQAGAAAVAGNAIYITGSYTVTSASTNVSGGCLSHPGGSGAASHGYFIGYTSSRGDGGRATLTASGISTFTLVTMASGATVQNIAVNGAGLTSSRGIRCNSGAVAINCKASNCTNGGFSVAGPNGAAFFCEATGCSSIAAFVAGFAYACSAYSNTTAGFDSSNCTFCLSYSNSGASSDGFNMVSSTSLNCLAYGNGRDGFRFSTSGTSSYACAINCRSEANAGYGYRGTSGANGTRIYNCSTWNNTSGTVDSSIAINVGSIACSSDPSTASGSNDFTLNNTANGGALLRQAGYPSTIVPLSASTYPDVGPYQAAAVQSGGASILQIGGGVTMGVC